MDSLLSSPFRNVLPGTSPASDIAGNPFAAQRHFIGFSPSSSLSHSTDLNRDMTEESIHTEGLTRSRSVQTHRRPGSLHNQLQRTSGQTGTLSSVNEISAQLSRLTQHRIVP